MFRNTNQRQRQQQEQAQQELRQSQQQTQQRRRMTLVFPILYTFLLLFIGVLTLNANITNISYSTVSQSSSPLSFSFTAWHSYNSTIHSSSLPPPMMSISTAVQELHTNSCNNHTNKSAPSTHSIDTKLSASVPTTIALSTSTTNSRMPAWMTNYLKWHAKTHAQLLELSSTDGTTASLSSSSSSSSSTTSANFTNDKRNWKDYNFYIIRCLHIDRVCGGLSDRLHPLPVHVLIAARTQRLLYILWQRPLSLDHLLQVPFNHNTNSNNNSNGNDNNNYNNSSPLALQWTLPKWLESNILSQIGTNVPTITSYETLDRFLQQDLLNNTNNNKNELTTSRVTQSNSIQPNAQPQRQVVVDVNFHFGTDHGASYFDTHQIAVAEGFLNNAINTTTNSKHEKPTSTILPTFSQVFRPLWESTFRPVLWIQQQIDNELKYLDLSSNYVALHIRSNYTKDKSKDAGMIHQATNCALSLIAQQYQSPKQYNSIRQDVDSTPSSITLAGIQKSHLYVASDTVAAIQNTLAYIHQINYDKLSSQPKTKKTTMNGNQTNKTPNQQNNRPSHPFRSRTIASLPYPLKAVARNQTYMTHLDRDGSATWSDYGNIIVDLYLLQHATCIAYGRGSYGRLANHLSRDPACAIAYVQTVEHKTNYDWSKCQLEE